MTEIKTVMVDSHRMFVDGVMEILKNFEPFQIKCEGIFDEGRKLKSYLLQKETDLVIMELNLADQDGLVLIPELRRINRFMKILVLSSYSDTKFVKKALQSGADGYICKSNTADELKQGIYEIINDKTYLADGLYITPPARNKQISFSTNNGQGLYKDRFLIQKRLTKREQEILNLITQAKSNKEIATELYISDQTVGVHRKNIMRKLGVKNTVNLIKFAIEHQLV